MAPRDSDPTELPPVPSRDVLEAVLESRLEPVLSCVLAAADELSCRQGVRVELAELPLPALRRRRGLLQEEVRRVQHWYRLVRARRDLLVATACGPEELHVPVEAATHGGPLEHHLDPVEDALDPGQGLRGLLLLDRPIRGGGLPEQLHELADAQIRLTEYENALLAELAVATDVLAERCRTLFRPTAP
ncbi:hypothetical protein [Kineococcus sp. NPDC059986]|jgi:hypothetical protein|uniref:hypothetical protein n=1 Tax=Kineococcus sp. NPDC059986 TaxID=3155538 RepID=UPI00344EC5D8